MAPTCVNKMPKMLTIRKPGKKVAPKPWHIPKVPEFDKDAMLRSLLQYIDRVTYDDDIFNFGDAYGSRNQHGPMDPKGLADLHLLINAILDVAPWARVNKEHMKMCVLSAIHHSHNRKVLTDCSYEEAAGRVAKQVPRGCLIFL